MLYLLASLLVSLVVASKPSKKCDADKKYGEICNFLAYCMDLLTKMGQFKSGNEDSIDAAYEEFLGLVADDIHIGRGWGRTRTWYNKDEFVNGATMEDGSFLTFEEWWECDCQFAATLSIPLLTCEEDYYVATFLAQEIWFADSTPDDGELGPYEMVHNPALHTWEVYATKRGEYKLKRFTWLNLGDSTWDDL